MKRPLVLIALACLCGSSSWAGADAGQTIQANDQKLTPAVAKVADLVKGSNGKLFAYSEIDDASPGGQTIGIGIVVQIGKPPRLVRYDGDQLQPIMQAILSEANASGKVGWRRISIVADNGAVIVDRGPSPGSIDGFNARLHAEVDRAFSSHS